MLRLRFAVLISVIAVVFAVSCGKSPEQARKELGQMNIQYSEETFIECIKNGDAVAVRLFLTAGMNPNAKENDGSTALMWAAVHGKSDIVKMLLEKGVEVNVKENKMGFTALMFAAMQEHADVVKLLLEKGAELAVIDNNGKTTLTYAKAKGDTAIIRLLKNAAVYHPLTEDIIKSFFVGMLHENQEPYELERIKYQEGSFTSKDAKEAIISYYDHNESHGGGWMKVWLVGFEERWTLIKKLEEGDECTFRLVDIDSDGKYEVWIEANGIGQGYMTKLGKLIFFKEGSESELFSYKGFDNTGAGATGEALEEHEVNFLDLDHDNKLEIVETVTTKSFTGSGDKYAPDYKYVEQAKNIQKNTYKLNGDKYAILTSN